MAISFELSVDDLDKLSQPQQTEENFKCLSKLGGVQALGALLKTDIKVGVDEITISDRLKTFGCNKMPQAPARPWMEFLIGALSDDTLIVLMVAAVVSLAVGLYADPESGWIEGTAILAAIGVVASVTATTDCAKAKQFRKLSAQAEDTKVKVIRGNVPKEISSFDVVVGDVVMLAAGDKIPADGVFIKGNNVTANESYLTGEPEDVDKDGLSDPFLLSGCQITGGHCYMLTIAVGSNSMWGKLMGDAQFEHDDTPLQEKLDSLAHQIGYIGTFFALLTFILMMVTWYEDPTDDDSLISELVDAFIMAITIIVVAVPEGLPLAVTISLAYASQRMIEDNILIRVLAACETMGNATAICTDKTGTLTENRMTVVEGFFAGKPFVFSEKREMSPEAFDLLSEGISVNTTAMLHIGEKSFNSSATVLGNKTEGALLLMLHVLGVDYLALRTVKFENNPQTRMFPFSSDRKRMSVIIEMPHQGFRLYCKGASEVVLADCTYQLETDGSVTSLTDEKRMDWNFCISKMANNALRTVVLAHKDFAPGKLSSLDDIDICDLEKDMVFDGLFGIMDPIRPDVPEAIKTCQSSGIMVRMITGDNLQTACAIGIKCGIYHPDQGGLALEGPTLRRMTPKELDDTIPRLQVVARASPRDKLLLVSRLNGRLPTDQASWQEQHPGCSWEKDRDLLLPGYYDEWIASSMIRKDAAEVVGVTGDGTNDAPALRAADVGMSMGISGTEVARAASDLILLDDNFSSILKAILWGRNIFDNIRKFLQFQLTVNLVALTLTLIGAAAGLNEPPINAVMMLWVNLIMDSMGALALATELPHNGLMNRPPYKRSANLINGVMWKNIIGHAFYQLFILMYILVLPSKFNLESGSREHYTFLFNAFVFCQVFNEFNARLLNCNFLRCCRGIIESPLFASVIVFTVVVQFLLIQFGGEFVQTTPLTGREWLETMLLGAISVPLQGLLNLIPPWTEPASSYAGSVFGKTIAQDADKAAKNSEDTPLLVTKQV